MLFHHSARVESRVDHEAAEDTSLRQSVQTVADREGVEESSKDGEDHDGDEVIEECLVIQCQGRVEDDGRQEEIEEELGCECRKGVVSLVLNVENVIDDDVVDDHTGNDTHNYQDAGLGE